jgi:hypothetical protein
MPRQRAGRLPGGGLYAMINSGIESIVVPAIRHNMRNRRGNWSPPYDVKTVVISGRLKSTIKIIPGP